MSISSVGAPPPTVPPRPVEAQPPAVKPDQDDYRTAPPPPQAALPPGQGTRVNIIA